MPKTGGFYFDWVDFPIKEPTMDALDAYRWPLPDPAQVNAQLGQQARQLYETTDYALVGSAVIGGGIFEQPARVMGLQNFLMALVSEPAFADRLMETITDIYIESCNNYLDMRRPVHPGFYLLGRCSRTERLVDQAGIVSEDDQAKAEAFSGSYQEED